MSTSNKLLGLDTAPAAALGHATALATTTTAATLTPEAPAATVAATSAVATTTLTLATVAARDGLETVISRSCGGGRSGFGCLRVIVSPRLRGRGRGGGGRAGLSLAGLAGDLDVHPLLGSGQLIAGIPLALAGCVGRLVGNLGVARGGARSSARGRVRRRVAVGQRGSGTLVDFSQARVGDGRVGLWVLLRLDGGLGLRVG
jgi:hypothetical protein